MKKTFLCIIVILIVIIIVIAVKIASNVAIANDIARFNEEIERTYKDKTLYGADVVTIINKAIDNNKNFNINKDENGNYISNDENSLKVDLILLSVSEKGEITEVCYPMEKLERAGLDGFVSSFSVTAFYKEKVEYNSTRKNF